MSSSKNLSKSDFQLASSCLKKLVYKKMGYPTSNDTNEYMEMLAKGGYVIGTMATMLYDGVEITGTTTEALMKTKELLQSNNCTLFEAAIQSGEKIIRIDILEKKGDKVNLIEVKAKSHDMEDEPFTQEKLLEKYIEDVAFQYLVLSEAYPNFDVTPYLLMPDKSKRTEIDGLAGWFSFEEPSEDTIKEVEELPAQLKPRFYKPIVKFKYENHPNKADYVNQLKSDGILQLRDVQQRVLQLQEVILNRSNHFISVLNNGITQSDYSISKSCKGCEFRTENNSQNGYMECWGDLANSDPNIFDLYYGGAIKNEQKEFYLNELIEKGKTSLYDIDIEVLKNKKGDFGARALRQVIQIENTKNDTEWISPEMAHEIQKLEYPLHFIDFETYTGALPFHKGMRPYELIAFQWSCHTITSKGATPLHHEWIQTGDEFPNFEFAKSLMTTIGNTGTPLMWATHENTILRTILNQLDIFCFQDDSLKQWLFNITSDSKTKREGRLIDMNKFTLQYYFHPYMKGKTSIKKVLPAIWNHFPELHEVEFFKEYAAKDFEGGIKDPYSTLKVEGDQEDDAVSGGTDAMRAFQRIRFDDSLTIIQKEELKRQLLQYCKLDTMAMVIIARHWGLG